MPKRVTVLAGVSGVGKTYRRTTDPELKDLPSIDIADIRSQHPLWTWDQAYRAFEQGLFKLLEEHDDVVAEGYFIPGSVTSGRLHTALKKWDVCARFIYLHAPLEVCEGRVASSGENVESRLRTLRDVYRRADYTYRTYGGTLDYEYTA